MFTITSKNYIKSNTGVQRQIHFTGEYDPYFTIRGNGIQEQQVYLTFQSSNETGRYYIANIPALPTGVYELVDYKPGLIEECALNIYSVEVQISVHVADIGWMAFQKENTILAGANNGQIEAFRVALLNKPPTMTVSCQAHVQDYGWLSPVGEWADCGTTGQSKRLEAFKITVYDNGVNPLASLRYLAEIDGLGWSPARIDGEVCGTIGELRAIRKMKFYQDLGLF